MASLVNSTKHQSSNSFKNRREKTLPNSFYEVRIILMPKSEKDITIKDITD